MIDYDTVRNTIGHETNVDLLRGLVATLLGVVERRRETLRSLDPIVEPAFRSEESDRTRGQMGQTQEPEVMRALARDVFKGIVSLDEQIAHRQPQGSIAARGVPLR